MLLTSYTVLTSSLLDRHIPTADCGVGNTGYERTGPASQSLGSARRYPDLTVDMQQVQGQGQSQDRANNMTATAAAGASMAGGEGQQSLKKQAGTFSHQPIIPSDSG